VQIRQTDLKIIYLLSAL